MNLYRFWLVSASQTRKFVRNRRRLLDRRQLGGKPLFDNQVAEIWEVEGIHDGLGMHAIACTP